MSDGQRQRAPRVRVWAVDRSGRWVDVTAASAARDDWPASATGAIVERPAGIVVRRWAASPGENRP